VLASCAYQRLRFLWRETPMFENADWQIAQLDMLERQ
jgi:hypothetical protein